MRQSEVFSYVMSMNWRYCIVLGLSGVGGRTMMVMDLWVGGIDVFPHRFGD